MNTTPGNTPVPRPDGGQWPHMYDAVVETLRAGGFYVAALGLVHVDVDKSDPVRPVVLSVEPSSDEEIERILACLAAVDIRPDDHDAAVLALRRGLRVTLNHRPVRPGDVLEPTGSPDTASRPA